MQGLSCVFFFPLLSGEEEEEGYPLDAHKCRYERRSRIDGLPRKYKDRWKDTGHVPSMCKAEDRLGTLTWVFRHCPLR